MRSKFLKKIKNISLAHRIAYSYVVIIVPFILFMAFTLILYTSESKRYDDMIDAAVRASEFSLDFKKDFDYETYLVIVESKSFDDSELKSMLNEATRVVKSLSSDVDTSDSNRERLEDASKYLENLSVYISRIEDNLKEGDKYEDNIEIWENDVQIVTSLVRETILQFMYYEIQEMQYLRQELKESYNTIMGIGAIVFVLTMIVITRISVYLARSISDPISKLSEVTNQVARGDLSVRSEIEDAGAEIGVLAKSLDEMIDQINRLLDQVTKEQQELRKTELELLQAQINPHFLYNTLDTIVWLAEGGNQKKVVSMVESLSSFFRTSLNQGRDIVSIREELKHVRSYLEIQQVRYQDILSYEIDVTEEIYDCLIPKITIQPLVENALYHGIKNKRGMGTIRITGKNMGSYFYIYVEDNGRGMTPDRLEKVRQHLSGAGEDDEVFGLHNINERIQLKFGGRYGIHMDSVYGEGTKAAIMLPFTQDHEI